MPWREVPLLEEWDKAPCRHRRPATPGQPETIDVTRRIRHAHPQGACVCAPTAGSCPSISTAGPGLPGMPERNVQRCHRTWRRNAAPSGLRGESWPVHGRSVAPRTQRWELQSAALGMAVKVTCRGPGINATRP
jgi:hypothetical protein